MGVLQKASEEIKRLDLGEGEWVDVHADISKRDFNKFVRYFPNRPVDASTQLSPSEALDFQSGLFEILVVAWSLAEGKPTVEDYLSLSSKTSTKLDEVLVEHFQTIAPTAEEGKAP